MTDTKKRDGSDSLDELVGLKRIVSEETFRSTPMVNQDDDMVRVTIDMKRTCWRGWKRKMFKQPNVTHEPCGKRL